MKTPGLLHQTAWKTPRDPPEHRQFLLLRRLSTHPPYRQSCCAATEAWNPRKRSSKPTNPGQIHTIIHPPVDPIFPCYAHLLRMSHLHIFPLPGHSSHLWPLVVILKNESFQPSFFGICTTQNLLCQAGEFIRL